MTKKIQTGRFTGSKVIAALMLSVFASAVQAHTGHGADGFAAGLAHPLGLDHLLAMFAVGVWSVLALPPSRAWAGPAVFMLALIASAALGAAGLRLPFLEYAISASVVVFGLMLVWATRRLPSGPGLALVAVAASLHGLAHGAEAPESASFAMYAAGFLLTTAMLHFGGIFVGLALRRWFAAQAPGILCAMGLAVSSTGLYLLTQF